MDACATANATHFIESDDIMQAFDDSAADLLSAMQRKEYKEALQKKFGNDWYEKNLLSLQ